MVEFIGVTSYSLMWWIRVASSVSSRILEVPRGTPFMCFMLLAWITRSHKHTHTHTHIHTYIHTHTHTHTQAHAHQHTRTSTHMHTHKHTFTHSHRHTQTHTKAHRVTHRLHAPPHTSPFPPRSLRVPSPTKYTSRHPRPGWK